MGQERETGASGGHEIAPQPRREDLPITAPSSEELGAEPTSALPLRREASLPMEEPTADNDPSSGHGEKEKASKPLSERRIDALVQSTISSFSKAPRPVERINGKGPEEHFKRIWREVLTGDKVHREVAISILSAIVLPFGPLIVGTLNVYNAIDELIAKGSKSRAALYAIAGVSEFALFFWIGQTLIANAAKSFVSSALPSVAGSFIGAGASSIIGLGTGIVTNTANWEMMREEAKAREKQNAIIARRQSLSQPEIREKIRAQISDASVLKKNLYIYLYGDGENGTELEQLQQLYESLNTPSRNIFKKLARIPLRKYYEHEITLEGIKRETATELLGLLNDLFPQENAGIVEN